MNPVIEAIMQRRSIRAYEPRPVPRELVEEVIRAGNEAPSGMNNQPWRFVVLETGESRRKLLEAAVPRAKKLYESLKESNPERYEAIQQRWREMEDPIYYSAPVIIFVIGHGRFSAHSCPLACENIMLAAHSMGLGTCWVGSGAMAADDPVIGKILELKEGETIFGPILLGYPRIRPGRPSKKEPVIKWIC
jgi:nitroreductase